MNNTVIINVIFNLNYISGFLEYLLRPDIIHIFLFNLLFLIGGEVYQFNMQNLIIQLQSALKQSPVSSCYSTQGF